MRFWLSILFYFLSIPNSEACYKNLATSLSKIAEKKLADLLKTPSTRSAHESNPEKETLILFDTFDTLSADEKVSIIGQTFAFGFPCETFNAAADWMFDQLSRPAKGLNRERYFFQSRDLANYCI